MATLHHINQSAYSSASPAAIYAILLDRPTWPSWSPLESFEHGSDGCDGPNSLGAIGTFVTGRTRSREELVELIPGRRVSYRLLSGLPLRDYRADIDLIPSDASTGTGAGTDISWQSTFHARFGTGWAYRFALGRFIRRCVRALAAEAGKREAVLC